MSSRGGGGLSAPLPHVQTSVPPVAAAAEIFHGTKLHFLHPFVLLSCASFHLGFAMLTPSLALGRRATRTMYAAAVGSTNPPWVQRARAGRAADRGVIVRVLSFDRIRTHCTFILNIWFSEKPTATAATSPLPPLPVPWIAQCGRTIGVFFTFASGRRET